MSPERKIIPYRPAESVLLGDSKIDGTERFQLLAEYGTDVILVLLLAEYGTDVILIQNPDGTIRYQSPSTRRILGYPADGLVGLNIDNFIHPDELPLLQDTERQVLRNGGTSTPTEFRFLCEDGRWRYLEGVVNNLIHFPGIEGLVLTARDVSSRKRAEEERRQLLADLAASEARLSNLLTHANCCLWQASVVETEVDPQWSKPLFDVQRKTVLRWVIEVTDERTVRQWLGLSGHHGASFTDTVNAARFPGEMERADALSTQALREGWPGYTQDLRYRADDGRTVWIHEDVKITRLTPGRWHLVGVCTDITQRKLAEQTLQTTHETLTRHMENLPVAMVQWDTQGRIRHWSHGAEQLFGWNADAVIGKTIGAELPLIHPDDSERANRAMEPLLSGKEPTGRVEYRNLTRTGETIYCQWNSSALLNDAGQVTSILAIGTDITPHYESERKLHTERQRAELQTRQLKHQTTDLVKQTGALKQQVSTLTKARDLAIATPPTSSSFLANLSEEQLEYAQTIYDRGTSLLSLLNDILDFSKVEAGKLTLESTPFELAPLVESVQMLMGDPARDKGVLLRPLEIAPGIPADVIGDPARLRQILVNIVGNAIKSTPEGGTVSIRLAPETAPHLTVAASSILIRFEVQDTGIGISSEAMSRLFQPFAQTDSATTRRFGEAGLGLTISKRLVELMGGRIQVENVGERSDTSGVLVRFTARLQTTAPAIPLIATPTIAPAIATPITETPIAVTPAPETLITATPIAVPTTLTPVPVTPVPVTPALVVPAPATPAEESSPLTATTAPVTPAVAETEPTESTEPFHVLVVEDRAINRRLVSSLLQRWGYQVTMTLNGREALEKLEQQPFDLVLMDCEMPGMDGLAATREWRRREAAIEGAERLPIIALTVGGTLEEQDACGAAGMDDYLPKPFSPDALFNILQRWSVAQ